MTRGGFFLGGHRDRADRVAAVTNVHFIDIVSGFDDDSGGELIDCVENRCFQYIEYSSFVWRSWTILRLICESRRMRRE